MGDIAIKVEGIGKQYRLGKVGVSSFKEDLKRAWYKAIGKEDPYLKEGDVNDRLIKGDSNLVWALKDINFEVKKGEMLGIIGKNGAGKSTLLKILSRVTAPTTGNFRVKGRISSLLEVGTGFHPELSGRENIFLNGAIMGMTKKEIHSKFDEIIDFSGVEKYIDTPVKRYSSGMYVRLAFAVAAHLEPEILIVDEVLAVGDAEFQKKCLGKMQDVNGKDGRTVLFVSHNISAVRNLCNKGLVLVNGNAAFNGEVNDAISFYQTSSSSDDSLNAVRIFQEDLSVPAQFKKIELIREDFSNTLQFEFTEKIGMQITVQIREKKPDYVIGFLMEDSESNIVFASTYDEYGNVFLENKPSGEYSISSFIPDRILKPGKYKISITIRGRTEVYHKIEQCFVLEIVDTQTYKGMKNLYRKQALLAPEITWSINE